MGSFSAAAVAFLCPTYSSSAAAAARFRSSSRASRLHPAWCRSPENDREIPPASAAKNKKNAFSSVLSSAIGGAGFIETGYLSYLKLAGREAFCPLGVGDGCGDVLDSDYSVVFGVPLPLLGMVAYGLVTLLSLRQVGRNSSSESYGQGSRFILLGVSTSMAAASGYFLYLLSTKLAGSSCSYCLLSAIMSFSLFFITLNDIGLKDIQKTIGLQLAIFGIVVGALSFSYTTASPTLRSTDIALDPFKTEITKESTSMAISLAEHLRSVGAKMYGAFWCLHCQDQKQVFGREATKLLNYVECYPDGIGEIENECVAAGIEGFPTWIIKDKVLSGLQNLQDLAEASGFIPTTTSSTQ